MEQLVEQSSEKAEIMVVEDERIIAKDIKRCLQDFGYDVPAVVSSGEEALQKIKQHWPDLVLMDIVLDGDIDGIETARQIHNRYDIPIIYLTAYTDEEILRRAKRAEPFGYIIKPFGDRELYSSIEMALYKHKKEKNLRVSEKWLSHALKSIGEAIIATDSKGNIVFMNPVAQWMTGWKEEEVMNRFLLEFIHIIDRKKLTCHNPVQKVLKNKEIFTIPYENTCLLSKDGTKRSIAGCCAPIYSDTDCVMGTVLVFNDMTNRKKMEEEEIKTHKLESIKTFAHKLSHNYNNVLMTILGNITIAKIYANPEDKVFKNLTKAEQTCRDAILITERLGISQK
jgi:two-component system cell cycle sensor histidine kinase/response regulator CckA